MRILLLIILFTTTSAFAGLDRLNIQNLNMDYSKPYGKGDVEKISIGFSTKSETSGPYPVEIHRTDKNLELKSPFVDITWNGPWAFFHNLEQMSASKVNASFGKREHSATLETASLTPEKQGVFKLNKIKAACNGKSLEMRVENRLLDDCREKLEVTVASLDVPVDFFMSQIVAQYPQEELRPEERPLDSLKLTSYKGDFSMVVYTRVVFYAGLRAWGHVSYEDNHTTIVIRIDQVKFGYLPITSVVLKELRNRIKHPNVTITGNIIRIKTI